MKAKVDSKSQLINTAYRLFLTKSYNSTSTSLICEEASINKGTFYHFFHSKADLLIACIQFHSQYLTDGLDTINNSDISSEKKLREFLLLSINPIREKFEETGQVSGCLLGNITLELSTIDNKVRTELVNETQKIYRALIPILRQYIQEKSIDIDVQNAADIIFAQLHGSILTAKLHNDLNRMFEALNTIPQVLMSQTTKNYEPECVE